MTFRSILDEELQKEYRDHMELMETVGFFSKIFKAFSLLSLML